jgi:hypothetical protein
MMGGQSKTESLFYYFRQEEQIPEDHLVFMDRSLGIRRGELGASRWIDCNF